ncbi:hypothetical protein GOP47_0001399 [Adiantum capillus-veneris]|uniref:Cytochrome P450 n=1 Tax=Adiantum capillus-veneris TaxID=13818 RepID=A0A9D4ZQ16_ADICA|nr:hypothetical protein GOP47_0001399 [Adiantum capillus-veneris]
MEPLIVCACAFMVLIVLLRRRAGRVQCLPPGPPGRPIIGHLHLLQPPLHLCLHTLSQQYGPIFFIKMGSSPAVVVSSPFWAKEFLHTHEHDFADRPQFEASKRIFYNNRTLVMMEYGSLWRHLRKLYTVHILSSKRVEMFENPRLEEMALSIKLLENQMCGAVVDLRKLVFNTVGNMMSRMLFSKRSFDVSEAADGGECRFKELVERTAVLFGTPFLGDLVPWLSWLDVQGARKRMDRVAKELDKFFEEVLVERIATSRGVSEEETDADYLDMLLRIYNEDGGMDRDSIKCILMDLLMASIETTTTAIEWTLAELLNNKSCMMKLQEEVDTLIQGEDAAVLNGSGKCLVRDSQLTKLGYLQAIFKESLRLHPPFALNLRQMCKALDTGIKVGGYDLPKKTRVIFNLWAMARDTTMWGANAGSFCPDRFLNDGAPDLRGHHYEFLPFGTGRRGCPGMSMALTVAPFVVANLVLRFNWETPDGIILDLSKEASSLTAPLATPLVAIPTLRRSSQ